MVLVVLVVLVLINIALGLYIKEMRRTQLLILSCTKQTYDLVDNYINDWLDSETFQKERIEKLYNSIEKKRKEINSLTKNIENIPKEITIKNVLSIP